MVEQDVDCRQRSFLMVALVLSSGAVAVLVVLVVLSGLVVGVAAVALGAGMVWPLGMYCSCVQYVTGRAAWHVSGFRNRRHVRAGLCRGLNTQSGPQLCPFEHHSVRCRATRSAACVFLVMRGPCGRATRCSSP